MLITSYAGTVPVVIVLAYRSRHSNTVVGSVTITCRRAIQLVALRGIQSRLVSFILFSGSDLSLVKMMLHADQFRYRCAGSYTTNAG